MADASLDRLPCSITELDGSEFDVVLVYRRLTASEWIAYSSRNTGIGASMPKDVSTVADGERYGKAIEAIMALAFEYGEKALVAVEGDVPKAKGEDLRAYLLREMPGAVIRLGRHVGGGGGVRVDRGKSETPSASSSAGGSAESNEPTANT